MHRELGTATRGGEARWARASRGSCPGYCRGLHIATFKTGRLKTTCPGRPTGECCALHRARHAAVRSAGWWWPVRACLGRGARPPPLGVWLQKARSGPRRHRAPSCPRGRKPSAPEMSGTTVGSGGRRPTPRRLTGEGRKGQPCPPGTTLVQFALPGSRGTRLRPASPRPHVFVQVPLPPTVAPLGSHAAPEPHLRALPWGACLEAQHLPASGLCPHSRGGP